MSNYTYFRNTISALVVWSHMDLLDVIVSEGQKNMYSSNCYALPLVTKQSFGPATLFPSNLSNSFHLTARETGHTVPHSTPKKKLMMVPATNAFPSQTRDNFGQDFFSFVNSLKQACEI